MAIDKHIDIRSFAKHICATGSRVICNPPPMDTDEDFIVLADSKKDSFDIVDEMDLKNYNLDGTDNYDPAANLDEGGWASFKKTIDGTLRNYIITQNEGFYYKWVFATELAKELNLIKKSDRQTLFSWIVDNSAIQFDQLGNEGNF